MTIFLPITKERILPVLDVIRDWKFEKLSRPGSKVSKTKYKNTGLQVRKGSLDFAPINVDPLRQMEVALI